MKPKRIIFFSGKGGVGKTTIAAATALACARRSHRTVLVSVDPAHNLSDIFETPVGNEPTMITNHLTALQVDPFQALDSNWGRIRDYIANLMATLGAEETIAGELAILPGMDNLFSLLRIKDLHDSGHYDAILVDMAPTGESLRLLSLPQIISLALKMTRYIEKYLLSPVIRPASRVSKSLRAVVASEDVSRSWEQVLERLLAMKKLFEEQAVTSTRLVLNPEKIVIAETRRALTYLNMFGMCVDQIVVNRIYPESAGEFLKPWIRLQKNHRAEIRSSFQPIPIVELPMMDREMIGLANLTEAAETLYARQDPAGLFWDQKPLQLISTRGQKKIRLHLPFLDEREAPVQLNQRGGELMLQVGSYLRTITLPDSLASFRATEAGYEEPWLDIHFKKNPA